MIGQASVTPFEQRLPGAETAVLYIHGILGTPDHFRDFFPLADGFSQYSILLDGHGGDARGLCRTRMSVWKQQVQDKVTELLSEHKNVILTAHSMGTLFALTEAVRRPDRIRGLFLWDVPLKLHVRPSLAVNCLKVFRGKIRPEDTEALAAQRAYGILPDYHIWRYAGWIPRYLELFREIRAVRESLPALDVRTRVFQSARDEMVSDQAAELLRKNPCVRVTVLPDSTHFYYAPADYQKLLDSFSAFLTECAPGR